MSNKNKTITECKGLLKKPKSSVFNAKTNKLGEKRSSNLQERIDDFKLEEMEENKVDKGIPTIKTQRAKQRKTE